MFAVWLSLSGAGAASIYLETLVLGSPCSAWLAILSYISEIIRTLKLAEKSEYE